MCGGPNLARRGRAYAPSPQLGGPVSRACLLPARSRPSNLQHNFPGMGAQMHALVRGFGFGQGEG
jgi:hypothetical protein